MRYLFLLAAAITMTAFSLLDRQPTAVARAMVLMPTASTSASVSIALSKTDAYQAVDMQGPKMGEPPQSVALIQTSSATVSTKKTPDDSIAVLGIAPVLEDAPSIVLPAAAAYLPALDALLRMYVDSNGKVDYVGLKRDKEALYAATIQMSELGEPSGSDAHKLAFYINLYNAYTLRLIVDHYPVASITEIHGGKPWDHKWIKVGGKILSLNGIEHEIIRPRFKDARIHFAVNCAAASCPPLLNAAFDPATLDKQLDTQTKAFINNVAYNRIEPSSLQLSKIFEWYKEDFGKVTSYVNKYSPIDISPSASVSYLEYDWALNQR